MLHRPTRLHCLLLLLAACPPAPAEPETTTESSTSTSTAGATSTDPTTTAPTSTSPDPSTTGSNDDTSGGVSATDASTTSATTSTSTTSTTSAETTSGSTGGLDTTGGTSTSTGDTGNTGSTGDTGDTGDTNDIPDTTGGEACGDEPDQVDIAWNLEFPPGVAGDVTTKCTTTDSQKQGSDVTVTFTCDLFGQQKPVVLTYAMLPNHTYPWNKGDKINLEYRVEQPWWKNEWLSISGGSTSFSAIRADAIAPPGTTVFDFFGLDFHLWALCDPVPDACGQRQGLGVTVPNPRGDYGVMVLKSGEHGQWGAPYSEHYYVDHASRLLDPILCDDVASVWVNALIMFDTTGI